LPSSSVGGNFTSSGSSTVRIKKRWRCIQSMLRWSWSAAERTSSGTHSR
jgi:hypothetical protein